MVRVISILLALLLVPLFAAAAGAIYVEGQTTPDDGMMHIMSADTGTAVPTSVTSGIAAISSFSIPAFTGNPAAMTFPDFSAGAGQVPPSPPSWNSSGVTGMEGGMIGGNIASGDIVSGDVISHYCEPPTPGYWDNLQDMDLQTNMPTFSVPALFK
jgi:hypothetical protein